MGVWNYRVLREEINHENQKSESVRVIEVYYNEDGSIQGWTDCTDTILHVVSNPLDDESYVYEDLQQTAHHVLDAFKLPMVAIGEDGNVYELLLNNENKENKTNIASENIASENYTITDDINKATHWIAKEDENNPTSNVTIGKSYKLIWDKQEQEHHIIDDKGTYSLIYLAHAGNYINYVVDNLKVNLDDMMKKVTPDNGKN